MYNFCTYFDSNYLIRGLALYQSLRQHCSSFRLWVLCMDAACYEILSDERLPYVNLIDLREFEEEDEELLRAKRNRTRIEYYFTCTPSLPLFVFSSVPQVNVVTYLDADLFFFADPAPIFSEMADRSVAIIEHRFPAGLRYLERYGIYNVGWLSFRRDEFALSCLRWWRERCIEWCYDRLDGGRFADQKYLDDWPSRFRNVAVLQHKGANLAPWNLANYEIRATRDQVWVDEQPLVFFHFHGFKQINRWVYDLGLANYEVPPSKPVRQRIYMPYIKTLSKAAERVSPNQSGIEVMSNIRYSRTGSSSPKEVPLVLSSARKAHSLLRGCKGILTRDYVFFIPERQS